MEKLEKVKLIKDSMGKQTGVDMSKILFYNYTEMDVNNDSVPDQ